MDQGTQFRFPTLEPWMRNLLIGAFLLYAAELVTRNAGFDVYTFAWSPFGNGFAPWQPLTRYFVQGDYVFGVLMGMLMVYFLLPGLWMQVSADRLRNALLAGAVGGSLLPMLADLAVGDVGLVMGWTTLAFVYLPTMFGLTMASHTIYLFFVIPVNGRFLLWMTAVVSGLVFALSLGCLLYTSPSPRDRTRSRMPSSA